MVDSKPAIYIESAQMSANIPVTSHEDYLFGFSVISEVFNEDNREFMGREIAALIPGATYERPWGWSQPHVSIFVRDKDSPGMCKSLVEMFQAAGRDVRAYGGASWTEPPFWGTSPEPQGAPESYQDLKDSITKIVLDNITP